MKVKQRKTKKETKLKMRSTDAEERTETKDRKERNEKNRSAAGVHK